MVFILSEVGLPKDYTRPTSSGKQFYRNKFTLTNIVFHRSGHHHLRHYNLWIYHHNSLCQRGVVIRLSDFLQRRRE